MCVPLPKSITERPTCCDAAKCGRTNLHRCGIMVCITKQRLSCIRPPRKCMGKGKESVLSWWRSRQRSQQALALLKQTKSSSVKLTL